MKKIRLAILAFGVTVFLSFCISTGSLERAGTEKVALANPTIDLISN